jgi:hypothetical protein
MGWGRPVYVRPRGLRIRRNGVAIDIEQLSAHIDR